MRSCRSRPSRAHISVPCTPPRVTIDPRRPRRQPRHPDPSESGSVTVEVVLLAPVLVLLLLFGVYVGRLSQANTHVRHAADQAARAATLASPTGLGDAARTAALSDLARNGVGCVDPSITTSIASSRGIQSVTVVVRCSIDRRDLAILGLGTQTVTARSTEVIDRHRGVGW